ncbi:MAG: RNA-binding S4 domain-containing protein, partial [Bacteroidales bacterium]|nr:RNA-binding S4 domain-containing protein [Bacteroidales bacterium]
MADSVRVDKYIWAIRLFKTRSEATDACKGNKVKVGGQPAKPSREVKSGDTIEVRKGAVVMTY